MNERNTAAATAVMHTVDAASLFMAQAGQTAGIRRDIRVGPSTVVPLAMNADRPIVSGRYRLRTFFGRLMIVRQVWRRRCERTQDTFGAPQVNGKLCADLAALSAGWGRGLTASALIPSAVCLNLKCQIMYSI
jgi:hypothetical protein